MLQLLNKDSLNLEGYTVIIPSVCIGNAAQLSCDLLISSKELTRIGNISHPAIIPIFGPSAYQHSKDKAAACELYESVEDKLLVIQFRSPFISRHSADFHDELAKMLRGCQRVIVLSASFSFEKRVIESTPYAYRVSQKFSDIYGSELKSVEWKEFTGEVVHGGGNCMQLFESLEREEIPVMLLFRYLLEGDNSIEAPLILREVNQIYKDFLGLSTGTDGELKLTVPVSWKLLFGNDVADILY